MDNTILRVNHLKTNFYTSYGEVRAVDDISFSLRKGEILCLVGESGCGKTTVALSVLRLLDSPPGKILGGEILFSGEDLLRCSVDRLRQIRGNKIAMIFQDPQSSLNPVLTIGDQIEEPLKLHLRLNHKEAMVRTANLMAQVGIPMAREHLRDYPHQFSGGMKQRVMIAAALSCNPEILIADEPTTALDTTVKAQILEIFQDIKQKTSMSILFITHDLGTVAGIADRIVVMYGGKIVEAGTTLDIFDQPGHPYTRGLLNCLPSVSTSKDRLISIQGTIPSLINPPGGCIFHPRCESRMPVCKEVSPKESLISGEHIVACHLYEQERIA
ncbi:MAG: dipeptide/oligopeptide/nickel ABC transporter ATP-binding protein [Chloroflexi bacterium RBG_16_50_9]|nr:MAG: dipeptide/oligopeptide/nickel ABC transporter ATP-binding protein [Chloroflexi bacterium RBG_16_50_9]